MTRRFLDFSIPRPELDELVQKSIERVSNLSSEELKELKRVQAESWARGEMGIDQDEKQDNEAHLKSGSKLSCQSKVA